MKYLSLDIETTCLQPSPDHILMVSMIVEDSIQNIPVEELPHFTCFVKHDQIKGEAYALGMNGWILDYISGRTKNPPYPVLAADLYTDDGKEWVTQACNFLEKHFGKDRITVAGKNVAGFDIPFMPWPIRERFRHRCIDPGSMFIDWNAKMAPDLAECKRRAGLSSDVAHDAREDAMDVIRLLRTTYPKKLMPTGD